MNRQVGSINMVGIANTRISFDLVSNGMHTIFCLDSVSTDNKYGIHRWITRLPNIIDKDFDGLRYKCKIIGIDEV